MKETGEKLKIQTKAFGELEILKAQCLTFSDGLFGFSNRKDFALLDVAPNSYFKWLQDLNDPELAFVIIQPEFVFDDYQPKIAKEDIAEIGLADLSEALVFVLVTIPEGAPNQMTANLQGPIVINVAAKSGKQVISNSLDHTVRAPVITGDAG